MSGKGDTPRPIEDRDHFDSEYERIFGRKPETKQEEADATQIAD